MSIAQLSGDEATEGAHDRAHDARIHDQFTRQAAPFARSSELHGEAQIRLIMDATAPKPDDESLDVACGPGTVVAAFATRVRRAVGLDTTDAMLDQARALAAHRKLHNVEWQLGDVYHLPFADHSFDIVSCRFAFHHFQEPAKALSEMARVCRSGGRVALCDAVASSDPAKAAAFNEMERHRDPSTAEFRPLSFLVDLFGKAGFRSPAIVRFQVSYQRDVLIAKSFPAHDDRAALRRMIDALIGNDALETGTVPGGASFIYPAAVLTAARP
jgi:ubiquinone/menaquinone biosynthesis C-methylase UbiE